MQRCSAILFKNVFSSYFVLVLKWYIFTYCSTSRSAVTNPTKLDLLSNPTYWRCTWEKVCIKTMKILNNTTDNTCYQFISKEVDTDCSEKGDREEAYTMEVQSPKSPSQAGFPSSVITMSPLLRRREGRAANEGRMYSLPWPSKDLKYFQHQYWRFQRLCKRMDGMGR